MTLFIFNSELSFVGRVSEFKSLQWRVGYNTIVAFSATCPASYRVILKEGYYVSDGKNASTITKVTLKEDTDTITINGYSALHAFKRAIISTVYINNAEQGVLGIISNNTRSLPVSVGAATGLTETWNTQYTLTDARDAILEILEVTDLGIKAEVTSQFGGTVQYSVFKGRDLRYNESTGGAVFSSERGNLTGQVITVDVSKEFNYAIVAGEGEGAERTIVYVGTATGAARKELVVDARDLQKEAEETQEEYEARLYNRGVAKLAEQKAIYSFSGNLVGDYEVGDYVTCVSDGYFFDARITVILTVFEKNTIKKVATIGEPQRR